MVRLGLASCVVVLAIDLAGKAVAVAAADGLVLNRDRGDDMGHRLLMCAVAFAVTAALQAGATRRGIGRLWGGWLGVGLLVGGVLGNGISWWIWGGGVPDFIHVGDEYVWNLADFAIGIGLTGGIASIAVAAVAAYAVSLRARGGSR